MNRSRDRIFARRALYVSAALTALGCSKDDKPPKQVDSVASATATTKASAKPVAPETPWSEIAKDIPPLSVPSDVTLTDLEKSSLKGLETQMQERHRKLQELWETVPGCDPVAKGCSDWDALAEKAQGFYRMVEGHGVPGCGGVSGETGTVRARRVAHNAYLSSVVARLEKQLGVRASAYGTKSERAWEKLLKTAKEPPPMPCLSPCLRPETEDVPQTIPFPKGSAELDEEHADTQSQLTAALAAIRYNGDKATVMVRGHVTAGEDAKLAEARAKAVSSWLVEQGVAAKLIEEKPLGSSLPVAAGAAEENARVDFAVVPVAK